MTGGVNKMCINKCMYLCWPAEYKHYYFSFFAAWSVLAGALVINIYIKLKTSMGLHSFLTYFQK